MKAKFISFYFLTTLLMGLLFFCYLFADTTAEMMDFVGMCYFVTSCLSHAALINLAVFLVFCLPCALTHHEKIGRTLTIVAECLLLVLIVANLEIFRIYRFHFNGIILNMLTGPGAGEIFNIGGVVYFKSALIIAFLVLVVLGLWWLAGKWSFSRRLSRGLAWGLVGCLLVANGLHTYGAFVQRGSIISSTRVIPYYFPLEATRTLESWGVKHSPNVLNANVGKGNVNFPLHPLKVANAKRPNIIFILIDSWNMRTLTKETMPAAWHFAMDNQWYHNHFSSSNGTRYSIFGMFFSVPSIYWNSMESGHVSPPFINTLLNEGYNIRIHASATLKNPPFSRIVFQRVPHLQTDTPGAGSYDRDRRITEDFIRELPELKKSGKPFYSMLFYDLAHAISLPADKNKPFRPACSEIDYSNLTNDMDPTPLFNLYRNCCYNIDLFLAQVFTALKREGLDKNTIIMLTGDHGQEFNENHMNYWTHNGNFSRWQVCVPLILHIPGQKPHQYAYRTTHYDIVPTMMHDYLGVTNPISDYSVGHLLSDSHASRAWQVVGGDLQYAFIAPGDVILKKEGDGSLTITDKHLRPLPGYHVNVKQFNQAMDCLNRYFKK